MVEALVFVTKPLNAVNKKTQSKLYITYSLGFNRFNSIVNKMTSSRPRRLHWIKITTIRSEGRILEEQRKTWCEKSPLEKWNKPSGCGEEATGVAKETAVFKNSKQRSRRA